MSTALDYKEPFQHSPETENDDEDALARLKGMRILIVDDIPDNIELIRRMLSRTGFNNFFFATNGEKAVKKVQQESQGNTCNIDIILLDIMMPGALDGYDVCRTLRQHHQWENIPIIMITATETWQDKTVQAGFDVGATDVLFKPIKRSTLIPRVFSALSLKNERDIRHKKELELKTELVERRAIESKLQFLINHDELTKLCNRRQLKESIEDAIQLSNENNISYALLYIDLDQFKVINDMESHSTGDRLLIEIANYLKDLAGADSVVSRISADEYAILLRDISQDNAIKKATHIRKMIEGYSFSSPTRRYHISASIGVSLVTPSVTTTTSDVFTQANAACFTAKSHGRNTVHLYSNSDTEMHNLRDSAHWVPLIKRALDSDLFELYFQPVINLASNAISHYEVLIRMNLGKGHIAVPGNFIPVAERVGLIHHIDKWVIKNTFLSLKNIPHTHENISFTLNLSGFAFQDPDLLSHIRQMINTTGIDASRVTFEITETAAVSNIEQTKKLVTQIRKLGCKFALDDFGTGFSSYTYLKHIEIDYIKIDGSFISNILKDPVDKILVKSIIEIAKKMGKKVIAEFIEDAETMELLREYGADYAQGYFIGKPSPQLR